MIRDYSSDDSSDEVRLGRAIEENEARERAATRSRARMKNLLIAAGAKPAELEKNVGVLTVADNVGGMPRGYIVGLPPVEALQAVLSGAAQFLPDHPHQKPPDWLLKVHGELARADEGASPAAPPPVPPPPPPAPDTPFPELPLETALSVIASTADVAQLERWAAAEAELGSQARAAVIDAIDSRIEKLEPEAPAAKVVTKPMAAAVTKPMAPGRQERPEKPKK